MPQPIGEATVSPADEVQAEVGRILPHEPGIPRRPVVSPSPPNGSAGGRPAFHQSRPGTPANPSSPLLFEVPPAPAPDEEATRRTGKHRFDDPRPEDNLRS